MSRLRREQRKLSRIEERLLADDPRLRSLFAVFARVTRDEVMPAGERIDARPGLLRWAASGRSGRLGGRVFAPRRRGVSSGAPAPLDRRRPGAGWG